MRETDSTALRHATLIREWLSLQSMKAAEIKGRGPVEELTVKITHKDDVRDVRDGTLKVCDLTTEDDSGRVTVTLWNEDIEKYNVGDTIKITKGWANEYQGKVSVGSGKFGSIEKVE